MTKIYFLKDPITNEIRYVGKTKYSLNDRLCKHVATTENNHRANWIRKILKSDLKPIIELIEEVNDNEWKFWETFWIFQFKCWGFNLTNATNGGECGIISPQCREAALNAVKGKPNKRKGIPIPDYVKEKISQKLIGRKLSKETLERRSKTITGRKLSEINKINIGLANSKAVEQYDMEGNYIQTFVSVSEAARQIGGTCSLIARTISGERNHHKKFKWKYKINENNK